MEPKIDLADDDFGAVLNCAVRYCIGRQTYMPELVIDYIKPLLPYISNRTLKVMESDIKSADNYGDEVIDKPEWIRFLQGIKKEIERRENGALLR